MAYRTIQELIASKRSEISSTEAQIGSLEEKMRELRAELKGVEEAANLLSQVIRPQTVGGRGNVPRSNGRRGRGLSAHWKAVLWEMGQAREKTVRVKEIVSFCVTVGAPTAPKTVRSQIRQFVKRGYLSRVGRVGEGTYRLTDEGSLAAKKGRRIKGPPGTLASGGPDQPDDERGGSSSNESREDTASLVELPGARPAQPGE